jgi:recombination protein RecT
MEGIMSTVQQKHTTALTIGDLIEQRRTELIEALPRSIDAQRFIRVALTAIQRTPELAQCTPASLYAGILQAAQLGLEIGLQNQAHLVPYWNNERKCYEAQFQIGYLGLRDLAERYGDIIDGDAQLVREGDVFDYELGSDPRLVHKPAFAQRGEITHAYAWARPKNGSLKIAVMTREEIEAHRDAFVRRKKDGSFGPAWTKTFPAMALKTVMRQLYKYLARSPELRTAIALDEMAEAEVPQGLGRELLSEQTTAARAQNAAALAALQAGQPAPTEEPSRPELTDAEPDEPESVEPEEPSESDDSLRHRLADLVAQASASQKGRAVLRSLKITDPLLVPSEQILFAIAQLTRACDGAGKERT